jgi:hypothetical protein
MATTAEVIQRALSLILVQGSEAPIEQDEAGSAVIALNRMMASWEGSGIALGYTAVSSLADLITVPEYALDGIEQNLALRLAPEFDGMVSPLLVQNARFAKQDLVKANLTVASTSYPDIMPMGSGNTGTGRSAYNSPFYQTDKPVAPPAPPIPFVPPDCFPEPIGPCSTATERYLWQMDGQSMYWRRTSDDYGQTTNARLRVAFVGGSSVGLQYLVGRRFDSRFYIALSDGLVVFGNGSSGVQGRISVDLTKINYAELTADGTSVKFYVNNVLISVQPQEWTGLLDNVGFGCRVDVISSFYSGSIYAVAVETDNESDEYLLDGNDLYEFPDRPEERINFIQNGEPVDTNFWAATSSTLSVTNDGYMQVLSVAATDSSMCQSFSTESGKIYAVRFESKQGTVSAPECRIGTSINDGSIKVVSTSVGVNYLSFTATGATTYLSLGFNYTQPGQTTFWRSISVLKGSDARLTREFGNPDGSDIITINRQPGNNGWTDTATGINFDYAGGALPE